MNLISQFLRDNAEWVVPIALAIFGGFGWVIKNNFTKKTTASQSQSATENSFAIQAGRDVQVNKKTDE